MNWKTIRLELAATTDFPKGSVGRGYLIRAPMNGDNKIDEEALREAPQRAQVRRIWPNEPDEHGKLLRIDGHWALRVKGKPDGLIDLAAQMRPGKQVIVTLDGTQSPFVVRIFD